MNMIALVPYVFALFLIIVGFREKALFKRYKVPVHYLARVLSGHRTLDLLKIWFGSTVTSITTSLVFAFTSKSQVFLFAIAAVVVILGMLGVLSIRFCMTLKPEELNLKKLGRMKPASMLVLLKLSVVMSAFLIDLTKLLIAR